MPYYTKKRNYRRAYRSTEDETRFVDTNLAVVANSPSGGYVPSSPDGTAILYSLNNIVEGTSNYQRIGIKCWYRYVRICAQVKWYNTTYPINNQQMSEVPVTCNVRMIVFWDKQPNNIPLGDVSQLLQDVDVNGDATTTNRSNFNVSNRNRFIILYDKYTTLSVPTARTPALSPQTMSVEEFIPMSKRLVSIFNNEAASIATISPTSGALYFLYYPDLDPEDNMALAGNVRVAFNKMER